LQGPKDNQSMTLDIDLKPEYIQSLGNRESLVSFFTSLRYNTEARIKQSAANLGIGTESVVREIKYIEQIASQEGAKILYVFLFEVRSVTVALTNALARSFRNKAGEYLLVITNDYEQLDFVLVERSIPIAESNSSIGEKQVLVRPRVLTIERRKPTRKQLRVLRRFTYTETDPLYQFDKLKSAYSIYDWSEDHFNNRILFADYYLQERLRDQPEWREDVKPLYLKVREIMSEAAHVWQGKSESDLRVGLYEKLFTILGFTSKREKDSKDDSPTPDYFLFAKSSENPIAVCLCYPWGRSLDGKDDLRDQDTPEENPSAAVVSILKDSKAPWAIVTNGKLWRLYNAKTSSIAASFYEIDLEETLAAPTQLASPSTFDLSDSFKYFSLFFRREAFEPRTEMVAGEERATTFLDSLLRGSEEYAMRLGARLKDRVFDEVFIHFADGFIEFIKKRDGKDADLSQENLDEVFQGTLTLLYRLLFMLYAESRDLFPVKEIRGYFEKSLTRLKLEIAEAGGPIAAEVEEKLKAKHTVSGTILYDRLLELFRVVDQGDASINVPMYNGGLFLSKPAADDQSEDARLARFLLETKVPDRYLANGLDLLARDEDDKTFKQVSIDFKSLGVRQLGSIYEGLLEFKLRVAREKMAVVRGKKTEEVVPYDEAVEKGLKIISERKDGAKAERIIPRGRLYLENDKRERKATGSYYTPDYIVKYIVENTVGPVLKEKFERLAPEFRKAQAWHKEMLNRKEARQSQKLKILIPLKEREGEEDLTRFNTLVHDLFDVKVLDPAMGSGHFLVDAADSISDRLIDFLNGFPWNPVNKMLDDTRKTILGEMEKQGVAIDSGRLTDVNLIKRHVLKRCVYGVDLNPMAVELAKVSLWLNCFTLGAPLSFLDHHLKCGNSLIGGDIDEVKAELEKDLFGTQLAGLMQATQQMIHVGELSDVTPDMIHESKRTFQHATAVLQPFKEVLDFWVSQYFGNEVVRNIFKAGDFPQIGPQWKKELLARKTVSVKGNGKEEKIAVSDLLQLADEQADKRRFFHWELEFPEVFYERGRKIKSGGFDAVMGNPPWEITEHESEKLYLATTFPLQSGQPDLYRFFLEGSHRSLTEPGYLSFVTPISWYSIPAAERFREFLIHEVSLRQLIRLAGQPFADVSAIPCITLIERGGNSASAVLCGQIDDRHKVLEVIAGAISNEDLPKDRPWSFEELFEPQALAMIGKLKHVSETLGRIAEFTVGYQLYHKDLHSKTEIENKVYHSHYRESSNQIGEIDGDSVARYYVDEEPRSYVDMRADFFRIPAERFLSGERILVREIASNGIIHATLTRSQLLHPKAVISIVKRDSIDDYSHLYLLGCFNSTLVGWIFTKIGEKSRQDLFPRLSSKSIDRIPIRRVHFTTPKKERSELVEKGKRLYENCLTNDDPLSVTEFVEHLLPKDEQGNFLAFKEGATGTEEKSDVVHDLLALLAEEMVRLNEGKQAEMKRFLGWLEKKARITEGIDSLSGKTTLQGYIGNYQKNESEVPFEEILLVLQKNKSKLGVGIGQPTLIADLKREHEASLAKLLPIKHTLAATDRLIDQIVYKLYGLTEQEIGVVEGKGDY